MSIINQFVSPTTRRQSMSSVQSKFRTIHLRIHEDIHAFLKEDAAFNGLSIPAALELILAAHYKDKIERQQRILSELDPE